MPTHIQQLLRALPVDLQHKKSCPRNTTRGRIAEEEKQEKRRHESTKYSWGAAPLPTQQQAWANRRLRKFPGHWGSRMHSQHGDHFFVFVLQNMKYFLPIFQMCCPNTSSSPQVVLLQIPLQANNDFLPLYLLLILNDIMESFQIRCFCEYIYDTRISFKLCQKQWYVLLILKLGIGATGCPCALQKTRS